MRKAGAAATYGRANAVATSVSGWRVALLETKSENDTLTVVAPVGTARGR